MEVVSGRFQKISDVLAEMVPKIDLRDTYLFRHSLFANGKKNLRYIEARDAGHTNIYTSVQKEALTKKLQNKKNAMEFLMVFVADEKYGRTSSLYYGTYRIENILPLSPRFIPSDYPYRDETLNDCQIYIQLSKPIALPAGINGFRVKWLNFGKKSNRNWDEYGVNPYTGKIADKEILETW